jgi:DNA-directed RNA polymerase subunit M/transcription elongation factor TFIIS
MLESVKKIKQVCKCENCGNEAEMVITCSLQEAHPERKAADPEAARQHHESHQRVKGSATCSHCGNEADMWVDI